MVKSKYRISTLILNLFILLLAIPIAVIFVGSSNIMIYETKRPLLGLFFILGGFHLVGVYSAFIRMRRIRIDSELKVIRLSYFGLIRMRVSFTEVEGFKQITVYTRHKSYPGILLELKSGHQLQISGFEVANYEELENYFVYVLKMKNSMKSKMYKIPLLIFTGYIIVLGIFLIIKNYLVWHVI